VLACIGNVVDAATVARLRAALAEAEFVDGKSTAGFRARRVKNNEQLGRDHPDRGALDRLVVEALERNAEVRRAAWPRTIMRPMFSRYRPGMNYGRHVDDALMGAQPKLRTDLSVTLFLSEPGEYDGGELLLVTPFGEQSIKLPAGAAVIYPSILLHEVRPVTRGERLVVVTWIQSYIREAWQRETLHDLERIRNKLAAIAGDSPEADLAFKTLSNLLRMWSQN